MADTAELEYHNPQTDEWLTLPAVEVPPCVEADGHFACLGSFVDYLHREYGELRVKGDG